MLTPHQQEILNKSLAILKNSDRLVIKGSAGVGKTYMVNELLKELRKFVSGTFYCSAPTNKAVAVLKDKISKDKNSVLITIQKALKITRVIDEVTGKVEFKPKIDKKYPPLNKVKYLIIDESSMLSLQNLMDVEEHAQLQGCKVIFIGDNKQLNPVGEEDSPVFLGKPTIVLKERYNKEHYPSDSIIRNYDDKNLIVFVPYPTVELTEIVRQKGGSPIIDLSRNLDLINSRESAKNENGGYIYSNEYERVIATLAHVNGSDELKYLAYTNIEVDKVNRDVRIAIYGNTPAKIEKDETIVFDAPYGEYYTNEELKVERVLVREKQFKFITYRDRVSNNNNLYETATLKYYSINFTEATEELFDNSDSWASSDSSKTIIDEILVIHEDSEDVLRRIGIYLKGKAKTKQIDWVDYYNFVEQFASMKYNHAITIHKSQGSTYKQAIVNIKDVNLNKDLIEKKRLLYTSVTRASDLLILYNV